MSAITAPKAAGHAAIAERLLASAEPSVRWKVRTRVLGESPDSPAVVGLCQEIKESDRVKMLLSNRNAAGQLEPVRNVYAKWQGAHWVLSHLADLGYPAGDESLIPIRDQVLDCWLEDQYFKEFEAKSKSLAYSKEGVPVMQGRHRRCGSQQGNALWSILQLGLADDRAEQLAERLLHWQWPDGGWNCDKNPDADSSSFMETMHPMRALWLFGEVSGDNKAKQAAMRASRVFLDRSMFKRRSDGGVIRPEFLKLHYPLYWRYDIVGGLKAMCELGLIEDPGCESALDILESMRLPDGGWPATAKFYKHSSELKLGNDSIDWGGTSKLHMNEWVTADALAVLKAAGRLEGMAG